LFQDLSKSVSLELLEATKYPSGDVSLRYAPRADGPFAPEGTVVSGGLRERKAAEDRNR
jgi:hypothetical protein